jgi:ribosome maturation factor RimP
MTEGNAASEARITGESGVAAAVAKLVEPVLRDLGFRLVRVVVGGGASPTLQVMAERADGTMTVEDCAVVSRELSPLLDAHEPIATRYTLEVSSPGIDRPLVRASDFEAWRGWYAKLETKEPIAGRRRFRGILRGLAGGAVRLFLEEGRGEEIAVPLAALAEARLVLTDALVREALKRSKRGEGRGRQGAEQA